MEKGLPFLFQSLFTLQTLSPFERCLLTSGPSSSLLHPCLDDSRGALQPPSVKAQPELLLGYPERKGRGSVEKDEEDKIVSVFVHPIPNNGFLQEGAACAAPMASIEHGHDSCFVSEDTPGRVLEIRVTDELVSSGRDKGLDAAVQQGVDLEDEGLVSFQK